MCLSGCSEYWLFGTNIYKPRKACCDRQLGVLPTSFLACFYNSLFPSWVHWIKNLISCQNIVESWSEFCSIDLAGIAANRTEGASELIWCNPVLKDGLGFGVRSDCGVISVCSGSCPELWVFQWREILQPLWAVCLHCSEDWASGSSKGTYIYVCFSIWFSVNIN